MNEARAIEAHKFAGIDVAMADNVFDINIPRSPGSSVILVLTNSRFVLASSLKGSMRKALS